MPKVSVVIPTFNRRDLINQSIQSVQAQTYQDYEVIIVDDGSTDNTREILEPLLLKHNFHYFYQENQKQAIARNNGIRNSCGEYIAFLDSDDLWHPRKLEYQVIVLEQHPEIGMVYSNQSLIQNNHKEKPIKYPYGLLKSGEIFKDLLLRKYYCSTPSILVRKSVLDEVGLFDENLGNALEDWELTLRISQDYKVYCIDEPLMLRRLHDGSPDNYFELRNNNLQRILKKYLKNPDLSKPFTNKVWSKAYFTCGHSYFLNSCYKKALFCFLKAFFKGHWAAGAAAGLSLLGPLGKKIFRHSMKLKY